MLGLDLNPAVRADLPGLHDILIHLRDTDKQSAVDVLRRAHAAGTFAVQPRCGVGGHEAMQTLLQGLEEGGQPDILSVTIDAHTRLGRFDKATETLRNNPENLNGYPLVSHGWQRGRELDACVRAPLEIRHGSPDPRDLFAVAIASGITSFEGGGIGYNLPYSKDVPLDHSLEAWRQVDEACGALAADGVIIDRELFGTLTAVLVPPSVSLACTVLEGIAAQRAGVRCLSVAYPQQGEVAQDVAALRAIRGLAQKYLPDGVEVYPVLHQFMGVFPRTRPRADALILYGALVARLGGATKVITKTYQEGYGVPDVTANVAGLRTARLATSEFLGFVDSFVASDAERINEEQSWIEQEVAELVDPVLAEPDLLPAIRDAFAQGRLDIPFSASIHAHSQVIPQRDRRGAIRYRSAGRLPFSAATLVRHERHLADGSKPADERLVEAITADINYFMEPA
jgi:methylaspartate mutase epsilon subunit